MEAVNYVRGEGSRSGSMSDEYHRHQITFHTMNAVKQTLAIVGAPCYQGRNEYDCFVEREIWAPHWWNIHSRHRTKASTTLLAT